MSPDFRIGEAHLYSAEPAGSTWTTDAIDGERERVRMRERERQMHISSLNRGNVMVSDPDNEPSVILKLK